MKNTFQRVVMLTCMLSACNVFAFAKADFFDNDGATFRLRESVVITDPTNTGSPLNEKNTPALKDSAAVAAPVLPAERIKIEKTAPQLKPTVEKKSKEEDDSILSFNFLYYIIEKYKLQDIVN